MIPITYQMLSWGWMVIGELLRLTTVLFSTQLQKYNLAKQFHYLRIRCDKTLKWRRSTWPTLVYLAQTLWELNLERVLQHWIWRQNPVIFRHLIEVHFALSLYYLVQLRMSVLTCMSYWPAVCWIFWSHHKSCFVASLCHWFTWRKLIKFGSNFSVNSGGPTKSRPEPSGRHPEPSGHRPEPFGHCP